MLAGTPTCAERRHMDKGCATVQGLLGGEPCLGVTCAGKAGDAIEGEEAHCSQYIGQSDWCVLVRLRGDQF